MDTIPNELWSRRAIIVSSPNAYRMGTDILATALGHVLSDLGFDVLQITREARAPETTKDDIWFFLQLGVGDHFRPQPGLKIIWNFHPTAPDARWGAIPRRDFIIIARTVKKGHAEVVWDYQPESTESFRAAGVPAIHVPVSYHESMTNPKEYLFDRGPHFIGRLGNPRSNRARITSAVDARVYGGVWGDRRRRVTRLPGVHLSLRHYRGFGSCLTLRLVSLLAANARAIVHEKTDFCPFVHEDHCLVGEEREIPSLVSTLMEDELRRIRLGEKCLRYIRSEYRLDVFVTRALNDLGVI